MDPTEAFSAVHPFRWDLRPPEPSPAPPLPLPLPPPPITPLPHRELEELVEGYGVRPSTVARISELGFTASTLLAMTERELDDMTAALATVFRWDLLLGERFGLRAALRAERSRLLLLGGGDAQRHAALLHHHHQSSSTMDAVSQEDEGEDAAESGEGEEEEAGKKSKKKQKKKGTGKKSKKQRRKKGIDEEEEEEEGEEEEGVGGWESTESSAGGGGGGGGGGGERQREHPFVVTEPGEVARAKKNGLDYLFHLYEQCRLFLLQVQSLAKLNGHKCPTKVTNQVFRYANKVGASYINKPKMRHYVHCYALHCLDEEASNALRRAYKERGENVGAWRQACYAPLVHISAAHAWDIDAVFAAHPRLAIWYVPTKLRQLCHHARSTASASAHHLADVLAPPPPSMF